MFVNTAVTHAGSRFEDAMFDDCMLQCLSIVPVVAGQSSPHEVTRALHLVTPAVQAALHELVLLVVWVVKLLEYDRFRVAGISRFAVVSLHNAL